MFEAGDAFSKAYNLSIFAWHQFFDVRPGAYMYTCQASSHQNELTIHRVAYSSRHESLSDLRQFSLYLDRDHMDVCFFAGNYMCIFI